MRKPEWPEILVEKMAQWSEVPFVWGEADCATFVLDVVNAMTGRDIVNNSYGKYRTEIGAAREILTRWHGIEDMLAKLFGDSVPVTFAQRGDVLLRGNNLGICIGANGAFRIPEGLATFPALTCEKAWRVE